MIYVIGLDTDITFLYFLKESVKRGAEIQPINLRALVEGQWRFAVPEDGSTFLVLDNERICLNPHGSYYCRLIDISSVASSPSIGIQWRGMLVGMTAWLTHIPGIVVNRPGFRCDNGAKPLHEYLLQVLGLSVPPSITSSRGEQLYRFAQSGPTIVKALSGVRANSRLVDPDEFLNFDPLRGPVHLQRYITGSDVRAHVVGDEVYAELIRSSEADYRRGEDNIYEKYELPQSLSDRIVSATKTVGLSLAGWDFKVTDEGQFWCLEVNPMPAFDSYDRRLKGSITDALLRFLKGGQKVVS